MISTELLFGFITGLRSEVSLRNLESTLGTRYEEKTLAEFFRKFLPNISQKIKGEAKKASWATITDSGDRQVNTLFAKF